MTQKLKVEIPMNVNRKKILTVVLVLVSAGVLTGGVYYTWLITPPGLPKTAQEGLKTIGSARYERLPEYRKQDYLQRTQELMAKMPEQERQQLMQESRDNPAMRQSFRAIGENFLNQRLMEYAKASPEDRVKMLDAIIDAQEKGQGFFGPRGGGPGGMGRRDQPRASGNSSPQNGPRGDHPRGPGHGGRMRQRMQHFAQEGNPQRAGLMGEFFEAMRQRRIERGLPEGPGGRHR